MTGGAALIYKKQEVYEAALELRRRHEDSKILFYRPCCRVHKKYDDKGNFQLNDCPTLPCPDSRQWKFHMSDKRTRIVFGANRSSKSFSGMAELLLMACFNKHPFRKTENPKRGRYRVYSPDFALIEKLYIPLIREWIPRDSLKGAGANKSEAWANSYDSRNHILRLKGDRTIDFMSYDQDASKSESVELDGIWADEEMPESVYGAASARLISRKGKFWLTVTPLYGISWAMKFLDSLSDHEEIFNFDIYDNPYISAQAIKEFESSIPEHEKDARLRGRFMELQGLVYKELRRDIHLIAPEEPKPGYPVIFSLDPHPRKPSVMTWAYVTPKDDVVFFDELEMAGSAKDIAFAIKSKEANHKVRTTLRLIDPAARGQGSNFSFETDTVTEFEREGLDFSLADNSESGYNIVHEYLSYNPNLPLSSMNRPKCFFTNDCKKTWYGMTHLLWDEWAFKTGMKDKKEKIRDYKKDFPDTVRYVLASRPTYRSFSGMGPVPLGNFANQDTQTNEFRQFVFAGRHV